MDINIDRPIEISIDVIEFDEKIPSIKILLRMVAEKFGRSILVNTTCWLECAVFDEFIHLLRDGKFASIKDMSGDFFMAVDVKRGKFVWSYANTDLNGNVMRAGGEEFLVDGAKEKILMEFESFPKWW